MKLSSLSFSLTVIFLFMGSGNVFAQDKIVWDSSKEPPGVFFHWYEPSFYAGFAPRTQNPKAAHIRLSSGNQVRVTLVLNESDLNAYLASLIKREDTYNDLIASKTIELSTNLAFERYAAALSRLKVRQILAESPSPRKETILHVMKELNPERVFEVSFSVDQLIADWKQYLVQQSIDATASTALKIDAANALFPGRLNIYLLNPEQEQKLTALIVSARADNPDKDTLTQAYTRLLSEFSQDIYRIENGEIRAVEFTTIYPAGTIDGWTDYKGKKLPAFGVTGVWKLIPREKGKSQVGMVDYISTNPGYGFIIMLPYQYASGIEYNVFHNASVRLPLSGTPFLPKEWKSVAGERDPKQQYQNLWAVGRGPISHGCTRLGSGHMTEMRQLLPSSSDMLKGIDSFRSLPQCYDLYDIDGDGTKEVMGVQYYYSYKTNEARMPLYTYAPNERKAYYKWLYRDNVYYDDDDRAYLKDVPLCRFGVKKAEEIQVLHDLPLYEAQTPPELIQFYKTKGFASDSATAFTLTRELARLSSEYPTNRSALRLK